MVVGATRIHGQLDGCVDEFERPRRLLVLESATVQHISQSQVRERATVQHILQSRMRQGVAVQSAAVIRNTILWASVSDFLRKSQNPESRHHKFLKLFMLQILKLFMLSGVAAYIYIIYIYIYIYYVQPGPQVF